jgi:hypothetical protein
MGGWVAQTQNRWHQHQRAVCARKHHKWRHLPGGVRCARCKARRNINDKDDT